MSEVVISNLLSSIVSIIATLSGVYVVYIKVKANSRIARKNRRSIKTVHRIVNSERTELLNHINVLRQAVNALVIPGREPTVIVTPVGGGIVAQPASPTSDAGGRESANVEVSGTSVGKEGQPSDSPSD